MCNRKICLDFDYDYDWIIKKISDYDYDYDCLWIIPKIDYDYDYVIDWQSIGNRLLFRLN